MLQLPREGHWTMTDPSQHERETFEEFKNSFSYGSRSDLNFKFLKYLPDDRAADFFQELLYRLGDSVDDGTVDRLTEVFYEFQCEAYAGGTKWSYADGPFTELEKPISESRVALVTSSGHFVAGNDPQPFGVADMSQEEAAARIDEFLSEKPTLSAIPVDTPLDQLRVRHAGYDIRTVQEDPNVALPLTRMQELAAAGRIGELSPTAYSFHGACAQNLLTRRAAPQWSRMLQLDGVEAVVLVPVCPVCHVSVGHVARELERAGMATVVIGSAPHQDRVLAMSLPRLVVTPHPMGRPLGAPHDVERQTEVLLAALDLLDNAVENGSVVEFPGSYRPTPAQ
jgi:D-proline reductase (dithiol) PrdB